LNIFHFDDKIMWKYMENMEWSMKKIIAFFILCVAFFALTSFSASGEERGRGEYVITRENGEYLLSVYSEGALSPIIRSDGITVISEYVNSIQSSASVYFKEVVLNEDLFISASDVCVSGSISFSDEATLIVDGGKITAEELSLVFSGGCVMINDGTFIFKKSEIAADDVAVMMDFSAGATAYFESAPDTVRFLLLSLLHKKTPRLCAAHVFPKMK
jgi:hypothetical protein